MTLQRKDLLQLSDIIEKKLNSVFDINTQYKFLQLSEYTDKEIKIMKAQLSLLLDKYGEKTKEGNFIFTDDGGVKIKNGQVAECQNKIDELHSFKVTVPDILFTLDELKNLSLSLKDLKALKPFIKE